MGKELKSMSDIEAERKPKKVNKTNQKETNTMNKKHIIVTIVLTLTLLAALGAMFVLGINYEKGINNRVTSEAKNMVSAVAIEKAEPKK